MVDACIADAINSQYPDEGPFPKRIDEERGVIINIASMVAKPVPGRCLTYGASKTAVLGISSGAADYLAPSGTRVNTVSPSIVASAMMGDRAVSVSRSSALCLIDDMNSLILRQRSKRELYFHDVSLSSMRWLQVSCI